MGLKSNFGFGIPITGFTFVYNPQYDSYDDYYGKPSPES